MHHTKRVTPELSSGAMADIAFLLLTFYMVTTEIKDNKGLTLILPPYQNTAIIKDVNDRNLFSINANSVDEVMVEGKSVSTLLGLRDQIKAFVLNNKRNPKWSDNPELAVVSIKTDRGTSYKLFLEALDEAQAAYYEIYSERVGLSVKAFRDMDLANPKNKAMHDRAKQGIPMNISIAEPSDIAR